VLLLLLHAGLLRLIQSLVYKVASANVSTGLGELARWAAAGLRTMTYPVVVLDSCVLELSDLMEFFEGNKLLLEVFAVEFVEVVIAKDSIIFQFLLEKLSYLLRSQLSLLEHFSRILRSTVKFILFMLNHLDSCLEESILLGSANDLLLELQFGNFFCGRLCIFSIFVLVVVRV